MSDPLERHPHFSVVRRLAVGGMGEVLLTRFDGNAHVTPGLVVVKRTIVDHPNRGHQDEMLREEGRVALRLRHANLVDTYAVDELEDHPLLVMEFLAGRSMAQVLGAAKRKSQPVPVNVALAVLHGAACGLHFAHTLRDGDTPLGLVHRDVSPANIFATFDGKVKVIDFGVAKADDSEIKTSTGILKGKLGYMSPEHAKGEKLDPRADLWSLGVVFWEMLVADRLFGGQNPAMTLYQITQGQVEGPSRRRPDLPPSVERLCMRLLTKDRDERIGSGAELVHEIERLPPELWKNAPVGGFLADRFPAEADAGRREAAEVARLQNAEPMPEGLVDGGGADGDQADVTTLIVSGQALLQRAVAAGTLSPDVLQSKKPPADEPPVDEHARTVAIHLSDVPSVDMVSDEAADVHSVVTAQPTPSPAPTYSQPPGPSATPLHQITGGAAAQAAGRAGGMPPPPRAPDVPRPTGPAPMPRHPYPAGRQASGPVRPAPHNPSGPVPVAPRPSGPMPAAPVPSAASPASRPMQPSGPMAPAPRARQPSDVSRRARRRAPSAVAVALATFGGLAVLMGLVFSAVASSRASAPLFVGYMTADGSDAVVARVDDVPPQAGPPFQVHLDAAQLALAPRTAREPVPRASLERALKSAGVYRRAELPKSSRQRVAAGLPAAITLLGLLSLALALPGLLLQPGAAQLALRAGLVLGTLAGAAVLVQEGALGWPGLRSLEEPPEVPRLLLNAPPPSLAGTDVPDDQRAAVEDAFRRARTAMLRGQPQAAIDALKPAVELKLSLPALYALLGEAYRALGKHHLAEGHYLRYLELSPAAPDRAEVDAYLKKLQGG